jgi:DNA-binding transcriptional LysR family regulator
MNNGHSSSFDECYSWVVLERMHDEIDLLVIPDPLHKPGLRYEPVFDYEQVLVVGSKHPLAGTSHIEP